MLPVPAGHLVIAGTGRAGTSFLVRWLGAAGLDIGEFGAADWNERARAGLERSLRGDAPKPYVVKDPWLSTYCEHVDPSLVDVLVVPVRALEAAAASRVRIEAEALADAIPGWGSDEFGTTNGGLIHRLSVDEQARTLAVGFYRLIDWAVTHDLRLRFIDFDRLGDAEYLVERLGAWLPDHDRARAAHTSLSVA